MIREKNIVGTAAIASHKQSILFHANIMKQPTSETKQELQFSVISILWSYDILDLNAFADDTLNAMIWWKLSSKSKKKIVGKGANAS